MTPLPLTVVAGYLGAGKTTLINRLLAGNHGLRLMVLVNDFGAINIDADLLASAEADTLTLTNGCVCCTMGADLFMALGDALDRRPRPDHLIVEASGIAEPARIANAAVAEPDLNYAGIVTVVDGTSFQDLAADPLIGPQITDQVRQADLLVVSKTDVAQVGKALATLSRAPVLAADQTDVLTDLVFAAKTAPVPKSGHVAHPAYSSWSFAGEVAMEKPILLAALKLRPAGIFRLKGKVRCNVNHGWEVHCVGKQVSLRKCAPVETTQLVAIGLANRLKRGDVAAWWDRAVGQNAQE